MPTPSVGPELFICTSSGPWWVARRRVRGRRATREYVDRERSGLEAEVPVLVQVVLRHHGGVEHDPLRDLDLDQVGHALALSDQTGETDAVGSLGRRVDD